MSKTSTLETRLKDLEDPRKDSKFDQFEVMIDFIDPITGKWDQTDVDLDFYTLIGDFKDEIRAVWTDFCKDNGFDPAKTEVVSLWCLPDVFEKEAC